MNTYRHGDLSFHKTDKVQGTKIADNTFVLALGEHTGHKHVITKKEGTCEVYRDASGNIFLMIDGSAVITHEEHAPITLKTGTYHMKHEREFDYFMGEVARVQD